VGRTAWYDPGVRLLILALSVVAAGQAPPDVDDALRQAAALEAAGNPGGAAKIYELALERAQAGTADRARTLDALSALEASIGQYASAIGRAREAAAIHAALGNARGQAMALNRVGRAAAYAGDFFEAEKAFRSAITLSKASGDREGHAEQLGNLGSVSLYLGRYSDALDAFERAIALTAAAPAEEWSRRRRRIVLANKATLDQRLGRYQQALAIYRELGTARDVRPAEQAQILVNQGVLYRRIGDPVKALQAYADAETLFARNRHADGELGAMKNRGLVLAVDLGRLEEAERTFSNVIDLATRIGNRRESLVTYLFRGDTRLSVGDGERARSDFAAALALARELRTPDEEWKALYGLGRVEPRFETAIEYLAQSVTVIERLREDIAELALRSEFFHDKREVYDALIAAHLENARPAEAFALIERSHSRTWRERLGLAGPVELASVQRQLPANVLLLDYWHAQIGSALVAVTRTRAAVLPVSVDEADVKALIDGLRTDIRLARTGARDRAWRAPAARLVRRHRARDRGGRRRTRARAVRAARRWRQPADSTGGGQLHADRGDSPAASCVDTPLGSPLAAAVAGVCRSRFFVSQPGRPLRAPCRSRCVRT
jgi:tetratricopeptide (TPR) repeat protein